MFKDNPMWPSSPRKNRATQGQGSRAASRIKRPFLASAAFAQMLDAIRQFGRDGGKRYKADLGHAGMHGHGQLGRETSFPALAICLGCW